MRILIFGENGQVARALQDEAEGVHDIAAAGRAQADLTVSGAAASAVRAHEPNVVINAAAYTAVDKAETERDAARRLNAQAVKEMAQTAKDAGAHFIPLSTDYVFDGESDAPYKEDHEANPLNVYGETKHEGERAALEANDQSVIVRTSWVFSEYGANFVKTMLRLGAERDALNIVDDQVGGPTSARDIARALLVIAGKKHRGAPGEGLYHFQSAPAISWAGFARKIFELAGQNVEVNPIPTKDYPTPAQRPLRTVLDCARIERDFGVAQPDWRASLRQVLGALKDKEPSP